MNPKKVTIELTNSEALVLFDFLARFNEHETFTECENFVFTEGEA